MSKANCPFWYCVWCPHVNGQASRERDGNPAFYWYKIKIKYKNSMYIYIYLLHTLLDIKEYFFYITITNVVTCLVRYMYM